jgi:Tfp pilus assembly protein PilZ
MSPLFDETAKAKKRANERKFYTIPIEFIARGFIHNGVLLNISPGGAFIEHDEMFKIGEKMSLTIPFTKSKKHVNILGEVIRTEIQGFAVKFLKKSKKMSAALN